MALKADRQTATDKDEKEQWQRGAIHPSWRQPIHPSWLKPRPEESSWGTVGLVGLLCFLVGVSFLLGRHYPSEPLPGHISPPAPLTSPPWAQPTVCPAIPHPTCLIAEQQVSTLTHQLANSEARADDWMYRYSLLNASQNALVANLAVQHSEERRHLREAVEEAQRREKEAQRKETEAKKIVASAVAVPVDDKRELEAVRAGGAEAFNWAMAHGRKTDLWHYIPSNGSSVWIVGQSPLAEGDDSFKTRECKLTGSEECCLTPDHEFKRIVGYKVISSDTKTTSIKQFWSARPQMTHEDERGIRFCVKDLAFRAFVKVVIYME